MGILKRIFISFIAKRLDGYKTIIGGIGMILLGIVYIISAVFPTEYLEGDIDKGILLISGGFTALGLGGKLEKLKKGEEK